MLHRLPPLAQDPWVQIEPLLTGNIAPLSMHP
jgi:hypothetical protein